MCFPPDGAEDNNADEDFTKSVGMEDERRFTAARRPGVSSLLTADELDIMMFF